MAQITQKIKPLERLRIEARGVRIASQRSVVETIGLIDLAQRAKSRGQTGARTVALRHSCRERRLGGANLFLDRSVQSGEVRLRNFDEIDLAICRTRRPALRGTTVRTGTCARNNQSDRQQNCPLPDHNHGAAIVTPLPSRSVVYLPSGKPVHSSTLPLTQWACTLVTSGASPSPNTMRGSLGGTVTSVCMNAPPEWGRVAAKDGHSCPQHIAMRLVSHHAQSDPRLAMSYVVHQE